MSWLSGIAGKAEELLNKVDQSAASLNNSVVSQGSRPTTPQQHSGPEYDANGASGTAFSSPAPHIRSVISYNK